MQNYWIWWCVAALVVVAELASGTVYLLMVAAGLLAGGLAAWMGYEFAVQFLLAAIIAALGCLGLQKVRARLPAQLESQRNANVQIDVGNEIMVNVWQLDGTAHVHYRGAQWTACLDAGQGAPQAGRHCIVAMRGNRLVLKPVSS